MSRTYPDSPVCAVGAIIFKENSVLLIRRGSSPAAGKWSIPGGVVKLGETLEQAVVREVSEETGLTVRPLTIGKVVERVFRDDQDRIEYHYVIIDYVCEESGGTLLAASDAADAKWVAIDSLNELDMTEETAGIICEVYARIFR